MHTLSAWFTRNPVAANLVMLLVIIAGFFTVQSIRIEGFPALPPSSVTITTIYPGASAEQTDRGVSRKIEKALEGMPGIKKISSFSEESMSSLWVQKVSGFDMDRFQNEIKSRVDSIENFPQLAERPVITRDEFNVEALLVQVYGNTDIDTLQKTARIVKEELLAHPKITKMTLFGLLPYEIRIEVDDDRLRSYGITLDEVAQAIQRASLDYRTGAIESSAGKVVIRADKKAFSYEEFASIPLRTLSDGSRLLVKDVAEVIDGFEEENLFARFQRMPSVGMMVYTSKKGHLIQVSKAAHEVIKKVRLQLPDGVKLDIWGEYSIYMKDRLSLLATNAWQGLLIVFCLLALFLNFKLAFWVAMGIPISLAGAVTLMGDRFLGYSLNDITTFGMIVVLGILVDDAIVVGESVFEVRSKIKDPVEGTIQGVHRVSTATIFGCFTTVAAFYPLLLIDNDIGKIFASFSVVVIISLFASLLESKLILPAHLARLNIDSSGPAGPLSRFWQMIQAICFGILSFINKRLYQPLLNTALRHRYAALMIFLTVAVCGISIIFNGWVRTVFFPEVPGQIITVTLRMKSGTPLNLTMDNITSIEQAAETVNAEAMAEFGTDEPPVARIMVALTGPFDAEIYAELQPEKSRKLETMTTLQRWREKVGTLEGVEELTFSGSFETGGGFAIELGARDEAVLQDAVERFSSALGRLDGVHDIRDNLRQGSPQIRLRLKPEAQHLGLSTSDLASQIGNAFGGLEVQRVQRDAEEVKVYVKYKGQRRRYMRDILDTRIQTARGEWLPLTLAATIETGYVPSSLNRRNGRRVVQVSASLDKKRISPSEAFKWIQKNITPELRSMYPELTVTGAGELEEMGEMRGGMKRALLMIFILIYVLLAVPLKSYWQPLVIMSVIPFGFVGAVIGHWVTGFPLSVLSFFGMLAAMGVVVNDSLVMLTQFNEIHSKGNSLQESLVMAGGTRFRAIVLTTVTTVCGLMPLLSETSEQAQYLIPAAVSLAWGELFATPITLLIIPVLINIANDGISLFKRSD
ncbi:MAG: efflux RND transporter permease subunit [Desulfobacterales bacterium]|nr:efflux RND transporter permease subunit [Desulfobacterales bacterium]